MSQIGQAAILLETVPMTPGHRFAWHVHPVHQLAWTDAGVVTVATEGGSWVLPPTRALWIPAGVVHETSATTATALRGIYLDPASMPARWTAPQPIAVSPLLAELICHLDGNPLSPEARTRAEAVLLDLLVPIDVVTIAVAMPSDARARELAQALLEDPADRRSLSEWGRVIGASARTLTRAFLADTGIPYSRWRTAVRIRAALPMLAEGKPVGHVASAVGYETASAFVAAFRRETGTTPAAYFTRRAP
jgi:AraC-like DNA-binding protein/quercetin dioxygenase-like cupin family protein